MVEVPVIQAFTHEGRGCRVGETICVSPAVAAALHRRGLVSLTKGYQTRVTTPEPTPEPEPVTTKRRYRRRDLTAESA